MLVFYQVNRGFQTRGPRTKLHMRCTQRLMGLFKEARLEQLPKDNNSEPDALAKLGSQKDATLLGGNTPGDSETS